METIRCRDCGQIKGTDEFSVERGKYRRPNCKYCRKASYRVLSKTEDYKRSKRLRELTYRYNITIEEYLDLVEKQENLCAICGNPPGSKALAVDHNHETGKTRALLCVECNFGIGWFREDVTRLQQAIDYLNLHEQTSLMRQPRARRRMGAR